MINYNQFRGIVAKKQKQQKYLSLGDNETVVYTLVDIKNGIRQNPWSGDEEDCWFVTFRDDEGNEKKWTVASLSIYRQFENQNIQEGDIVRVSKKVEGKRKRYIVEKITPTAPEPKEEVRKEDIPLIEKEEGTNE